MIEVVATGLTGNYQASAIFTMAMPLGLFAALIVWGFFGRKRPQ